MTTPFPAKRLLAAAVPMLAAGCAPAPEPSAAPATGASCVPGALATLKAGTLPFGTDEPVCPPWFVDDDPTSGKGFESAIAYAIADRLGYAKDKVSWVRVPSNAAIQPGPKTYDVDLNEFPITDERRQAVGFSSPCYDVKLPLTNGQVDAIVVDLPTAFFITSAELTGGKIVGPLPLGSGTPEQFGAVPDKGSALTGWVSGAVDALRSAGTPTALETQWLSSAGSAPELK